MSTRHVRFTSGWLVVAALVVLWGTSCNSIAGLGDFQFGSSSTGSGQGGQGGAAAATCSNSIKDAKETDVDCGGPSCPRCAIGKKCLATADCKAGDGCDLTTKTCDANTCNDGVQNGSETDLDCGGTCPGCGVGKLCLTTSDCLMGEGCDFTTKRCDADACKDGLKNGGETDVDCGGTCSGCPVGKTCLTDSDCLAGEGCDATTKMCDADKCHDGLKNGTETAG